MAQSLPLSMQDARFRKRRRNPSRAKSTDNHAEAPPVTVITAEGIVEAGASSPKGGTRVYFPQRAFKIDVVESYSSSPTESFASLPFQYRNHGKNNATLIVSLPSGRGQVQHPRRRCRHAMSPFLGRLIVMSSPIMTRLLILARTGQREQPLVRNDDDIGLRGIGSHDPRARRNEVTNVNRL